MSNKISIENVNINDLYQVKDYNNSSLDKSYDKEYSFNFIDDSVTDKKSDNIIKPKKKRKQLKKKNQMMKIII